MKRKLRKIVTLAISMLVSVSILAACGGDTIPLKDYPDYTYTNPEIDRNDDWRNDIISDTDITLDGLLDEDIWADQKSLVMTNAELEDVSVSVTTAFSENGVWFGVDVRDTALYIRPTRDPVFSACMEFYISTGNNVKLGKHDYQIRAAIDGRIKTLEGDPVKPDNPGWPWMINYVDFAMEVNIEGEINTDQCEGFTMETFMPWSALGLDKAPEQVYFYPAYNHATNNLDTEDRVTVYQPGGGFTSPEGWFPFGANGFNGILEPAGDYGHSQLGMKLTGKWSYDETDQSYTSPSSAMTQLFHKTYSGTKYMFSANIDVLSYRKDWAFVGLIGGADMDNGYTAMHALKDGGEGGINFFEIHDRADSWQGDVSIGPKDIKTATVKLSVVRDGEKFYFFANDILMMRQNLKDLGPSAPGLFAWDAGVKFSDIALEVDSAKVDAALGVLLMDMGDYGDSALGEGSVGVWNYNDNTKVYTSPSGLKASLFHKTYSGTKYMFSSDVKVVSYRKDWSFVGLVGGVNDAGGYTAMHALKDGNEGIVHMLEIHDGEGAWQGDSLNGAKNIKTETVTLSVLRDGDTFYYLADGTLIFTKVLKDYGASVPGLFTWDTSVEFSNVTLETDAAKVDAAIAELFAGDIGTVGADVLAGSFDYDSETKVYTSGDGTCQGFYKDFRGKQYVWSADVKFLNADGKEKSPQVGLIAYSNGVDAYVLELIGAFETSNKVSIADSWNYGGDYWFSSDPIPNELQYTDKITLTVARDGGDFYFFADGVFVRKYSNPELTAESAVGIVSWGSNTEFSNLALATDEPTIKEWIDKAAA